MTAFVHATVLLHETVDAVNVRDHCVYVDCTLGGAGHAELLLQRSDSARLLGIDRDLGALTAARQRLAPFGDRVIFHHGGFADFAAILAIGYPVALEANAEERETLGLISMTMIFSVSGSTAN